MGPYESVRRSSISGQPKQTFVRKFTSLSRENGKNKLNRSSNMIYLLRCHHALYLLTRDLKQLQLVDTLAQKLVGVHSNNKIFFCYKCFPLITSVKLNLNGLLLRRRNGGRKEGRRILLTRGQVVNHEYLGPTYLPTYLPLQLRTYVHSKLYCLYFEFLKYPRSWPVFKCLRSFFKYTPALRCTSLRCCRPE